MNNKSLIMILAFLIMLLFTNNMYTQNCEIINSHTDRIYSNSEINELEKRVCNLLNETNVVLNDNKFNIYYIPNYELRGRFGEIVSKYKKSDFIDGSILNRIHRESYIYINDKKYIDARVIVTNSSDSLIAFGNPKKLFTASRYSKNYISSYIYLIEKKVEMNIKYFFSITKAFFTPVFGVTDKNKIFVFLEDKIYTIEAFVKLYSEDDFFYDQFYN